MNSNKTKNSGKAGSRAITMASLILMTAMLFPFAGKLHCQTIDPSSDDVYAYNAGLDEGNYVSSSTASTEVDKEKLFKVVYSENQQYFIVSRHSSHDVNFPVYRLVKSREHEQLPTLPKMSSIYQVELSRDGLTAQDDLDGIIFMMKIFPRHIYYQIDPVSKLEFLLLFTSGQTFTVEERYHNDNLHKMKIITSKRISELHINNKGVLVNTNHKPTKANKNNPKYMTVSDYTLSAEIQP